MESIISPTATAKATLSSADIVKNSVLDLFSGQLAELTPMKVIIALAMGFVVGAIIAVVYRRTYRGVLFSPAFPLTLIMLTLITTPVVMCIKTNIALSMGMVGALSIVRFRTAIKDPMDTAFMFWALTMGILLGTELYLIAFVVVASISVIILALSFLKLPANTAYLLVLHYEDDATEEIQNELNRVKRRRLRSKTVTQNGAEMTVEIQLNDQRHDIVTRMLEIEGVYDATLVACQNEAGA